MARDLNEIRAALRALQGEVDRMGPIRLLSMFGSWARAVLGCMESRSY